MITPFRIITFAIFTFLIPGILLARRPDDPPRPKVRVAVVRDAPVIDGDLSDPVWSEAAVIDGLTEVDPDEGAPGSPHTKVLLARDAEHLYVAFLCMEPEPHRLVLQDMHREGYQSEDDAVKIVLDTFRDGKSGYYYLIDAAGGRLDAFVADNGQRRNYSWDGVWKGRARIYEDRWTAEMAIPFKGIAFGRDGLWGFNAERWRGPDRIRYRWTGWRREFAVTTMSEAGLLAGMENLEQGLGLEFRPYAKAKRKWENESGSENLTGDLGGEVSWRITPQLTGSLTFNTDFAETEADDRVVNLTRYPIFFPEKRDFFLQDSNYFEFGWSSGFNGSPDLIPFFSRRIGLVGGEEIPLLYGARLAGRTNGLDLGVLAVHTDSDSSAGVPSGELMVARPAYRVTDELKVGGILTSGDPDSDGHNYVGGADLAFSSTDRLPGLFTFNAFVIHSDDDESDERGSAYGLQSTLKTSDWYGKVETLYAQDDFHPALGFVRRSGERKYSGSVQWAPRPDDDWIRTYEFTLSPGCWTKSDGSIISKYLTTGLFEANFHSGDRFYVNHKLNTDRVDDDFTLLSGDVIRAGGYEWQSLQSGFSFSQNRRISGGVSLEGGGWYDGRRYSLSSSASWNPAACLELGASYSENRIERDAGNFTTRVEALRVNYDFTPDMRLATLVQADNVSDDLGLQSRFRWILEDGRELFFVVNSSWEETEGGDIIATGNDVTIKVEYSVRF